ncbi:hypothetical protein [Helicobacter sp. T3_23-1056]
MKNVGKIFALIALLAFGNLISLNAFPSEMATSGCFMTDTPLKEFYENGLTPQLASQKMCVDREFRKKVGRKYALILMQSLDTILADKSRILRTEWDNGSKIISYATSEIFPKEVVLLSEYYKKYGYIDAIVSATIYPRTTIDKVYAKLRKEIIHYVDFPGFLVHYHFVPLDAANKIFPPIMPRKDYSAFIDYDDGAKITFAISKSEREKLKKEAGDDYDKVIKSFSTFEMGESNGGGGKIYVWNYGRITWADSSRMLFEYDECYGYYFKQVGNDVWLIKLHYQCV